MSKIVFNIKGSLWIYEMTADALCFEDSYESTFFFLSFALLVSAQKMFFNFSSDTEHLFCIPPGASRSCGESPYRTR